MVGLDKKSELLDLYKKYPCRTLPNAFWKTDSSLADLKICLHQDSFGDTSGLALWGEDKMMALWCRKRADCPFSRRELAAYSFILVHDDALSLLNGFTFDRREPYFRIIHKGQPPVYNCPPQYKYVTADPENDLEAIAEVIRACYPGSTMTASAVRSWLDHPVYDPSLWVWVMDVETGRRAGLGIAEMDTELGEASIEWVQVHPDEQGKGLGKAVVAEILRRVADQAAFTTVSGREDNLTHPERLYRRCGFTGSDVWWLLAK
ncbi:MAG: GNAT family N-acetyltransferase [Anaerolineaceae bacterium]|nr:GNAT family N-acetyltransferase [Anaerolineaceae bacterium]